MKGGVQLAISDDERDRLMGELALEEELVRRLDGNPLAQLKPNPRQWDFLNSATHETMFSGLNQAGKSTALCLKAAYHLTGIYPKEYTGPKFDGPINSAIGGETAQSTRDLLCDRLLGTLGERGTGYIPSECVDEAKITRLTGGRSSTTIRTGPLTGGVSALCSLIRVVGSAFRATRSTG